MLPKAEQLGLDSVVGRSVRNFFPAALLSGGPATLPTLGVVHTLRRQTMRKVRYSTNLTQVGTTASHACRKYFHGPFWLNKARSYRATLPKLLSFYAFLWQVHIFALLNYTNEDGLCLKLG